MRTGIGSIPCSFRWRTNRSIGHRCDSRRAPKRPASFAATATVIGTLQGMAMTLQERSDLVLAFARVLFVNGQASDQAIAAAQRVAKALGLRGRIMLRWGELQLRAEDAGEQL